MRRRAKKFGGPHGVGGQSDARANLRNRRSLLQNDRFVSSLFHRYRGRHAPNAAAGNDDDPIVNRLVHLLLSSTRNRSPQAQRAPRTI